MGRERGGNCYHGIQVWVDWDLKMSHWRRRGLYSCFPRCCHCRWVFMVQSWKWVKHRMNSVTEHRWFMRAQMCLHAHLCAHFRSLHCVTVACHLRLTTVVFGRGTSPPRGSSEGGWEQFITHTGWGWLLGYCILGSGSKYSSAVWLGRARLSGWWWWRHVVIIDLAAGARQPINIYAVIALACAHT